MNDWRFDSVRSSIARRLGVDIGALGPVDRLKAGLGHLWFVISHPFDDGNGRIARAIGDLLLARGVLRKSDAGGRSTSYELNELPE